MNRHQIANAFDQAHQALAIAVDPLAAVDIATCAFNTALKQAAAGESFAEDDPNLPHIETAAINGLLARWEDLRANTFAVLNLEQSKSMAVKAPTTWHFNALTAAEELQHLEALFIQAAGSENGPLVQQAYRAWIRGLRNAAAELDTEAAIAATQETMRNTLAANNLHQVRDTTIRTYRDGIVADLKNGLYDGLNPNEVAARLRERFGVREYDWERLARSEMTQAQVLGKEAQYKEFGVTQYDYVTANDSRVSTICRANAAGSPYPVGGGPLPMRDSHPNCRCSVQAHLN